jgi:hypothetical protein
MTHNIPNLETGLAVASSLVGGTFVYLAQTSTDAALIADNWLQRHGLAVTLLFLALAAFAFSAKLLLKEKTSRITDRDALLASQAKHAEESEAKETRFRDSMLLTQKQITDAIDRQTTVIKENNEAVIRTLEKLRP